MSRFSPRGRSRGRIIVVLVTLVAGACGPARATAEPARRSPALGVHAMLYLDAPPAFKRSLLQQASDLGASLVRVDLPLALMHPSPTGPSDDAGLDEDLRLARETGQGLVGILGATPWWAAKCPDAVPVPRELTAPCPYADLNLYAAHVRELVQRSRGVIKAYEVINEPEGATWAGTPTQYAQMLSRTIDVVHATDPAAKVLIGGTPYGPGGLNFITKVLTTKGLDLPRRIDYANLHVRGPVASLPPQVASWQEFMNKLGVYKKVWVTEFGYASDPLAQVDRNFGGPKEAARWGGGDAGQAEYMRRSLPALLRNGVSKVFVTLRDGAPDLGLFQSEGLLRGAEDVAPQDVAPPVVRKPAFDAVRGLVTSGKLDSAVERGRRLNIRRLLGRFDPKRQCACW